MSSPMERDHSPAFDVRRIQPSPALAGFVRYYVYCDFLPVSDLPHPMTVSLLPVLNFFLADPCRAFEHADSTMRRLSPAVVIGPCDRRVAEVYMDGRYTSLMAVFQPTGFYRLFHTSPQEVRNFAFDASDVLGQAIAQTHDRIRDQRTPEAMARALDSMLRDRSRHALPATPLEHAADFLLNASGDYRMSIMAHASGLSDSSWRRRFQEQIGVAPKRFSRMIRFRRAVALKLGSPRRSWTDISIDAGYYDQAHLIAEFREFSDCIPSGLMRELAALPQSVVGSFFSDSRDWRATH
jgi:AraC-like DNA-binding protein